MQKSTGYTLTELIISLAVFAIVIAVVIGAFSSKKAGAADLSPITTHLRDIDASFIYSSRGTLAVFNTDKAKWETAAELCNELKPMDSNLRAVTLYYAETTSDSDVELVWNDSHTELSTPNGIDNAVCN